MVECRLLLATRRSVLMGLRRHRMGERRRLLADLLSMLISDLHSMVLGAKASLHRQCRSAHLRHQDGSTVTIQARGHHRHLGSTAVVRLSMRPLGIGTAVARHHRLLGITSADQSHSK